MLEEINIIEKLKAGVKNTIDVEWPNLDIKVQMRLPTSSDENKASIEAADYFKKFDIAIQAYNVGNYEDILDDYVLYKIISYNNNPVANNFDQFLTFLTPDVRKILLEKSKQFQNDRSPQIQRLDNDEFQKIVDDVKKKPDMIESLISSLSLARKVIRSLAAPASISQMVN